MRLRLLFLLISVCLAPRLALAFNCSDLNKLYKRQNAIQADSQRWIATLENQSRGEQVLLSTLQIEESQLRGTRVHIQAIEGAFQDVHSFLEDLKKDLAKSFEQSSALGALEEDLREKLKRNQDLSLSQVLKSTVFKHQAELGQRVALDLLNLARILEQLESERTNRDLLIAALLSESRSTNMIDRLAPKLEILLFAQMKSIASVNAINRDNDRAIEENKQKQSSALFRIVDNLDRISEQQQRQRESAIEVKRLNAFAQECGQAMLNVRTMIR